MKNLPQKIYLQLGFDTKKDGPDDFDNLDIEEISWCSDRIYPDDIEYTLINDAIRLLAEERQRQKEKEGYTPEHDDQHTVNELANAAASYLMTSSYNAAARIGLQPAPWWPWESKDWKPAPNNRIRELVKAGALIVAEIERLQRLESKDNETIHP